MARIPGLVLAAVGVALIGWAGFMLWPAKVDPHQGGEPALVVENPDVDLGDVPGGEYRTVKTTVRNISGRPARILNVPAACAKGCCHAPDNDEPILVSPGEAVEYSWRVLAAALGPFETSVPLYVDDGGLRAIPLTVRGKCIPPGGSHAPK